MLISHELPLCLLNLGKKINNYDYCLPHLLDKHEEYKNYFLKAKEEGRYIIMDNSLHELGEAYDTKRLLYWINELKPNEFIIPDVWENFTQSIVQAKYWLQYKLPKETLKVVVVQAKNYGEAVQCVKIYKDLGYKKIAFSYGANYYNTLSFHPNQDLGKALGRLHSISRMYNQGILTKYDNIHLLGCAVPQEFGWYNKIECIKSIDTSNPIMATLDNLNYGFFGLDSKPKSNLNNSFLIKPNKINYQLLFSNISKFRLINNFPILWPQNV